MFEVVQSNQPDTTLSWTVVPYQALSIGLCSWLSGHSVVAIDGWTLVSRSLCYYFQKINVKIKNLRIEFFTINI